MFNIMHKYKHLTLKEEKKLSFFKKSKKAAKVGAKKTAIILGISAVFGVGAFAFYKILDQKNSDNGSMTCDATTQCKEPSDLLAEKELERESKKEETISDKNTVNDSPKEDKKEENNPVKVNDFKGDFADWNKNCPENMIIVNKDNFLPSGYVPKTKNCRGKEVATIVFDDLNAMIDAAKKDGIKLWISSGYRSVELQTKLFNRQIEREKSKAVISQEEAEKRAAKVVARPGTSEHNTGLAIDFNGVEDDFYKTKEYKWLIENAHKFGFIERYSKKWQDITGVIYEPWHFRYVGKEHAEKIKNSGLCLEEYVSKNLK